ncbi:MAG: hypothetical protein R3C99_24755 [Pirellulaceae bacterium]
MSWCEPTKASRLDSTQRPYQIGLRLELQESIIVTRPGAVSLVQHLGFSAEASQQYVEPPFRLGRSQQLLSERRPGHDDSLASSARR